MVLTKTQFQLMSDDVLRVAFKRRRFCFR